MGKFIPFSSIKDQIEKILDKNIIIQNNDYVDKALKNHSYYTLVNGYKHLYLKDNETDFMTDGTLFEHFTEAYFIDVDISVLIFKYILFIERSLRTRVSYIIARDIGVKQEKYLVRNVYKNHRGLRANTLESLEYAIRNCRKESLTYYFKENKQNIPPWILINDISFFSTISWYEILPPNLKEEIVDDYTLGKFDNQKKEFDFFYYSMNFLRDYRNLVAHGRRNFKEKIKNFLDPRSALVFFGPDLLKQEDLQKGYGTKDLYAAILLILTYSLDDEVKRKFIQEFIVTLLPYIDENTYLPIHKINGKNIYELLNIPEDTIIRIISSYGNL